MQSLTILELYTPYNKSIYNELIVKYLLVLK